MIAEPTAPLVGNWSTQPIRWTGLSCFHAESPEQGPVPHGMRAKENCSKPRITVATGHWRERLVFTSKLKRSAIQGRKARRVKDRRYDQQGVEPAVTVRLREFGIGIQAWHQIVGQRLEQHDFIGIR